MLLTRSLEVAQLSIGYKFETLSLTPEQWASTSRDFIESREEMVVSNYAQYCSIVKTGIGKAKLIIGGEVDACKSINPQTHSYTVLILLKCGIASPRTRMTRSIGLS